MTEAERNIATRETEGSGVAPMPGVVAVVEAEGRLRRLFVVVERHRYLLALVSFLFGASSFVLIARGAHVGRWISISLPVSWLLAISQGVLTRWLSRFSWARGSPALLRFTIQTVHQETLFFCLPFLLATTTWDSGQAVFTGLVLIAAFVSMWDPLYYLHIAPRPWMQLAFHAFAMYLAMLTVPPLLGKLSTAHSLELASVTIGLLALPSLWLVIGVRLDGIKRWVLLPACALALAGLSWLARPWIPPATLWLSEGEMVTEMHPSRREPGQPLKQVTVSELAKRGIYVFTAVHAPRGISEPFFHVWYFDGKEQMRIPLKIAGGREEGYRAWSHKRVFPADPRGRWQVRLETATGQLIGLVKFCIVDDAEGDATGHVAGLHLGSWTPGEVPLLPALHLGTSPAAASTAETPPAAASSASPFNPVSTDPAESPP